jgi:hypothetical protein
MLNMEWITIEETKTHSMAEYGRKVKKGAI